VTFFDLAREAIVSIPPGPKGFKTENDPSAQIRPPGLENMPITCLTGIFLQDGVMNQILL
jgi:hypothetical protein